tara:strand:+ start:1724 stop:2491 length:768 start_codon:yes stop_codon:yes gene_type:complete
MKKSIEKKYQSKIIKCLKSLGIKKNDVIFCHSRMVFFNNFNIKNPKKICEIFLNSFLKTLGKKGVFSLPIFTYDHAKKKIFDKNNIKTNCGILSDYILKKRNLKIYPDPNLAVGIFEQKKFFSCLKNYDPYNENSFFSKLSKRNGKICFINTGPTSTFIHYIEKNLNVHYRYNKKFKGKILIKNKIKNFNSYLFVKKKKIKNSHPTLKFEKIVNKSKKIKIKKFDGGFISVISANNYKEIIEKTIQKDKNFFIKN